ncbi:MAG: phospho-N-acetylmuramoyl-pentapeptide-transferase [Candidatus Margulisiibacteriota bacterium]
MFGYVLLGAAAAFLTFLFLLPLVKLLRFWHLYQNIRNEGPAEHQKKQGTPTFGGIAIIMSILLFSLIFLDLDINLRLLALVLMMLAFFAIGFLDDYLKKIKSQNAGLRPRDKFLLQCVAALVFVWFIMLGDIQAGAWQMLFYVPFATLVIAGSSNAANLTDGLDGLLSVVVGVAFLALAGLAAKANQADIVLAAVICAGATFGFLSFNIKPAKIFMGDVGSLAIGALLGGIAVLLHKEWWLLLIGGVMVAETVSVILQVCAYKLWQRRVFKMAPLHHHFELLGFSELEVVLMFWLVAVVLGIVGYVLG